MNVRATLLAAQWALSRAERDGPCGEYGPGRDCPDHSADHDERCDALSTIVVDSIPLALIERDWERLLAIEA